jgi:hypothetical protein
MDEPEKSKIENLRNALYSRKIKIRPNFVLDLNEHKTEVPDKWTSDTESNGSQGNSTNNAEPKDFSHKIFWGAFIFFILSIVVSVYIYLHGGNVISPKNIKIDVIGPTSIKAGEDTVLEISITNKNNTTLEIADLVLEYPAGTRSATDKVTDLSHDRVIFGDIKPNETVRKTVKSVIFGEEATTARIGMVLEYRIPKSLSVFTKDDAYEVMIGSSPLTLSVDGLKEVNANQDYEVTLNLVSNSTETVKNIALIGEFPFGFEATNITPEPLPKTQVWNLGDIEAGGKRMIKIKGKMYGDHNDVRYFKFRVGTVDEKDNTKISSTVSSVTSDVSVKEPFVGVALVFDQSTGKNQTYVAKSDSVITGIINFTNNLDVPLYDVAIEARINGDIVASNTLKPSDGFYDSNSGVVRWNKQYYKDLETMPAKSANSVNYTFSTINSENNKILKLNNPEFTTDITVKAKRRLESGVPEEIVSTIRRTVKTQSDVNFTAEITHSTGPIENEGDMQLMVGKKMEYTVTWAVTNSFNKLSGTKARATLPDYVEWTGVVVGNGEKITYNKDSREVMWDIGDVAAQSNGQLSLRKVSFQIAFVPSVSQVQDLPYLVNLANFITHDTFTNTNIAGDHDPLNTELDTDPMFIYDNARVKQ